MKTPNLLRDLLVQAVFLCCFCSMGLAQIYQNSYGFNDDNHDHYSVAEAHVLGQTVQAGTHFFAGGNYAHFQQVDDAGALVWEVSKTNTSNDNNRAFHVDQDPFNTLGSFGGQTYMYAGIYERPGGNTGILGFIDDAGGNGTVVELVTPGWLHTNVLHAVAANTPNPAYLVTGFVSQGMGDTDSKQGYAALIDGATLSVIWTRLFDSTPNYTPDWDMLSNGIEIPGQGFFLSGSSNGHVTQDAFATKIDYLGNTIWDESYHYDSTPNAEYNIATSAVYDDVTDRIYQLVNLSETHCFAISAYDGTDPFTNRLPESMTFINGNYSNTAGYSLHLAPGGQALTVAGLVRDAWANGVDAEGNPISIAGSFPFMLNVDLGGTLINWQNIYPVPSSGYSSSSDIFDSFSAGQQPRILYPEMAHPKNSGDGYVMNGYRFDILSDPHDLESIETDLVGQNPCDVAPLGISFYNDSWLVENVVQNNGVSGTRVMGTILDVYEPQSVATCGQASDCQFTIDWNYLISPNACEIVDFFDATLAAAGTSLCYSWDFGDGGFSNLQNPQHIYGASGVYTVCLTVECCDDPTGASKQTLCKDVTIDCDDPCVPDAAFSMMDLGDCCYEFMDLTPSSVPGMSCQEWEILDASGNHIVTGVMGSSFVHCFTADGTYTICYVDCCVNPDGTITYATVCQDLVVDCACEEYPGAINTAILSQTCDDLVIGIWLNPALAADYCVDFIYDGVHYTSTYDATSGTYSVTIPTPCPGDYFGEILVYCCDDPTIVISHIMDFTVDHDCCCEVDPTFVIDQIDDCCFAFADLTPDADDSCNEWTVTDASGAIIAGFIGDSWTYCFPANGVYTVCNRDCCIQSDGTVIDEIHCEQVIVTNCGCDLPNADELTLVLVNNDVNCKQIGACVNFLDGTGLGSEYCVDWNWGDGTSQTNSADFCPFHEFECNGTYVVCATLYCCDDPSVTLTLCGEVIIDCPCVVPTDVNFDLVMNTDCSASVIISTPVDPCPQDLCYDWILPAGVVFNGAGNLVFPGNGVYTLCLWVYCCDDATIGYEVCQTVTIDCYCEVDPHFVIDPIDDCCFAFADLTPDTDDNCNQWSIYDEFGNLIAGFVGDFWTYCFDANGVYTVCNTDCCVLPDGTIDYVDYCDQLVVTNCGCELPNADELALVVVNDDVNCKQIGACVNFVDGTGLGSEYCIDWSWGDGSGQSNPADFCPFHDYACNGVYEVCAKIYCCEDPTDVIEICRQVVIECPCDLPTGINFDVLVNDDCTATPLVVFPDVPCPDEVCTEWILPVGVTQNAVTGNFEFPGDGNYTICLSVFCCDFPSVGYVICHDITIDCACELPNDADLELNLVGSDINCKSLGACVGFPVGTDVASLCIDWSWGDGSTQTESAAFCPLHNYACSGVYDVCATIYCCDDPTNVVTICGVYTIDCPCDLPSVEFNVNVNDDCSADADLIFGADVVCPDEICFEWTVVEPGVGVVSTGTGAHFDFPGDGVYQICLTVFCCNDPSINYSLCQLVDIDCPCVLPDDLEMEVVQHTDTHCREIGVCVIAIGGGNDTYCVDYSWGDGNTTSGTLDFCPEYEYACNGTYTVCAEVYCCNDPANRLTICKEVVIDCPCVLPQVGFSVVVNDDCTATPVIELPIDPCDEVCFSYFSPSPGVVYNAGTGQFEFPGSGTYQVCVDVFCCNGTGLGYSLCEDVTVECGCGVEADFNYDPANCSVYFVDQSIVDAGGVITSWNWTFGDGNTSNLNNPLHTYAVGGNYTVCLTVTAVFPDGSTCTDTFCEDIFVDCNDCDAFVMFTCDPAGCTITFNDVSTAGGGGVIIAWFWDFGDGNTSTLQFPTHTYGASGSYTVCLTVTVLMPDGTTCDKTFCNTTPYLNCDECNVFADFSYTPVDCSVNFTDLSFTGPGTNITGWFWNFGDSNSSNVQNPTHTFGASGTYTVCLTVFAVGPNGSQCSHFSCVEVTVDCDGDCPEPCELYPGFIYTIDPITSADGCCVQFFNNSYSGPYTTITGYLWDFGDGNGTMGMDPYHCYMSPGTYTVTLTVFGESSEGECAETYSFTVICDCEDTCPEDVDEDGHIGVSDLLAILGKFNQECE